MLSLTIKSSTYYATEEQWNASGPTPGDDGDHQELLAAVKAVLDQVESEGRDTGMGDAFSLLRDAIEIAESSPTYGPQANGADEVTTSKQREELLALGTDELDMLLTGLGVILKTRSAPQMNQELADDYMDLEKRVRQALSDAETTHVDC